MEDEITIALENKELLSGICGANDENLKIIEDFLGGKITARGNEIYFKSENKTSVLGFKTIIDTLSASMEEGEEPTPEYVIALCAEFTEVIDSSSNSSSDSSPPVLKEKSLIKDSIIHIPHGYNSVYPKSINQALYIKNMKENEICFCTGPAGTGKTYLAIAYALYMIITKKMRKLVLTRPVVEAGENLGFLPGDLMQKINPYLRPLYDAMESLAPYETIKRLEETRAIETAPLAYMRGRSLNDCMIILDEAQNTTKEQMKMFLTRIGKGARAIITGDTTQIDLPKKTESGLLQVLEILQGIKGISFSVLHSSDIARNPLIKKIIQVYDEREA